jgi:hypothetical protein
VINMIDIDVLCGPARWEDGAPPPAIYLRAGRIFVATPAREPMRDRIRYWLTSVNPKF